MFDLICHPTTAPTSVRSVSAKYQIVGPWLQLRWRVDGAAKIVLPAFTGRGRQDDLWQATCFEIFLKPAAGMAYSEFNLSPSESWAAYDLTGWRQGLSERAMSHDPVITPRKGGNVLIFDAAMPLDDLPELPAELSLTAVIEEEGGNKSFWAMAHGEGGQADFHDPACFAATLAPRQTP